MAKYIFSVQLINDQLQTISNGTDIGYYSSSPPYFFNWIEKDISSYSPTIASVERILIPGGIGDTSDRIDIEIGGNLPSYNLFSIKIASSLMISSTLTQFSKILADNDMSLLGMQVILRRYEIVSGSLVDADGTIEAMGVVEDIIDSDTVYTIGVNRPSFQRKAQMMKKIYQKDYPFATGSLIGKDLPLTLGEFKPEIVNDEIKWSGLAKLAQTSNKEDVYKNDNEFLFTGTDYPDGIYALSPSYISAKYIYSSGKSVFPVSDANPDSYSYPPYKIEIQLGTFFVWEDDSVPLTSGVHELTNLIGYYLKVVVGTGKDEYRRIVDISVDLDSHPGGYNTGILSVEIESVFSEILVDGTDAENQSWISIVKVNDIYTADFWPCKGFIDSIGDALTNKTELYYYTRPQDIENTTTVDDSTSPVTVTTKSDIVQLDSVFSRLPSFIFESDQVDKNNISLLSTGFKESQQKIDSFLILPFTDYEPVDIEKTDLADIWDEDDATGEWEFTTADGIFRDNGSNTFNPSLSGSIPLMYDKEETTYYRSRIQAAGDNLSHSLHGMTFKLPTFPKNFNPDNAYLGIKCEAGVGTTRGDSSLHFRISWRRHTGLAQHISGFDSGDAQWSLSNLKEVRLYSLPIFYFDTPPVSRNEFFFPNFLDLVGNIYNFTGYRQYELPGFEEKDNYDSVQFMAYFFELYFDAYITNGFNIDIFQLVLIFKKSASIGTNLYSPYQGRIFDDTWNSRKTSANMIVHLVDYIEMALRLQNWGELSTQPKIEWGKEYADYAIIDYSSDKGGFDYALLDNIKDFTPAIQLLSENEGWTDAFIKRICMSFFLVQYTDLSTGAEKIEFIGSKDSTPSTTIDFDDIIGKITPIKQKRNRGIFCEPIIRYAKNPGTKKYDKELKIMKTDDTEANYDAAVAAGDQEDYVVGLTGAEAKLAWMRGHILWLHIRRVEKPPKALTDNDFIWKDDDAKALLNMWFTYMGAIDTTGVPSGIEYEPKKHYGFSVPYEIGKDLQIMKRILINLPHQTDDNDVQVILTSVNKQRKSELVNVQFMTYGESVELAMFWQDISYSSPLYADVQDDSDLQSEEPLNDNDVQDFS